MILFGSGLGLNENDEVNKEILTKIFKTKTQKEWTEIFDKLDACVSPVLTLDEAPLYEHNKARNSFIKLNDGNMIPTMNWIKEYSSNRSYDMPKIGEHSNSILKELGYKDDQIKEFIKNRIVENQTISSKL